MAVGNKRVRQPAREKLSDAFMRDVLRAWKAYGEDALKVLALDDPATFCKLVASLMPKDTAEAIENTGVTVNVVSYSEREDADQYPERSEEPRRIMAS